MQYEVEQKFHVDDLADVQRALEALGARVGDAVTQTDVYLRHPSRSFADTDETLRLRRVGDANFITYKGPKIDATTKTRREIELPLGFGADHAARFQEILALLGFAVVIEVVKRRRKAVVDWHGTSIEVVLDEVEELGTFVELEIAADEAGLDAARSSLASLAAELELTRNERRGYCELRLGGRAGARPV